MTKTDIIAEIARKTGSTKALSAEMLNVLQELITKSLQDGKAVTITGFVTFKPRHRKARTGRNPQTGKPIQIAASTAVSVTAGKALKDAVKSKSKKK